MAPTGTEISVATIFVWPHFQAVLDGQPLVGGKLYTYAPETSTPKASYLDGGFVNPQTNPVLLDDQGAATVYLDGYYRLRLTDPDEVLIWEVANFTFDSGVPPPEGDLIMGSTEATLQPTPGAPVLTYGNMAPAGYRIKGVTWTCVSGFGTANGLTSILLGDATAIDRWGQITDLTTGQTGGQLAFRAGDEPISPTAYTLLASAAGGTFDGTGQLHCQVYYESLPSDTP